MNEDNKKRVSKGVKMLALAAYTLITIATCSAVWSYCPEVAVKVMSGILFLCNAFAIYRLGKHITSSED